MVARFSRWRVEGHESRVSLLFRFPIPFLLSPLPPPAPLSPRTAAISLLALAALGRLALRWGRPDAPPGEVLNAPRMVQSPARQRDSALRAATPLGPGERVDLDRAGVAELQRLPGVGPALAARIVSDRGAHGDFGSLAGLDRVPGVGPTLLSRIAPFSAFSGAPTVPDAVADTVGLHLAPGEHLLTQLPDPVPLPAPGRRRR